MSGHTREALCSTAQNISVLKKWRIYDTLDKSHIRRSYSYSFETRAFYNAKNASDHADLLNLYSDGVNPINLIAVSDFFNQTLRYADIASVAHNLTRRGIVPFIGYWEHYSGFYTDVSIAVNHGISDPDVMAILKEHDQMYAARITADGMFLFP